MDSATGTETTRSLGWYWTGAGVSLAVPISGVLHFATGRGTAVITGTVFWALFAVAAVLGAIATAHETRRPRPKLGMFLLTLCWGTLSLCAVVAGLFLLLAMELGGTQ
ncbi:MAG: hypothetical protein LKF88_03465 [Microbacteriaceae bacterium]|jgi:hypothetical protein|nr:hypothetical protein [Microbacteriaceae bacterium]MCI1207027.1 hypothetical protein [Microbacteriaceae bacterium]